MLLLWVPCWSCSWLEVETGSRGHSEQGRPQPSAGLLGADSSGLLSSTGLEQGPRGPGCAIPGPRSLSAPVSDPPLRRAGVSKGNSAFEDMGVRLPEQPAQTSGACRLRAFFPENVHGPSEAFPSS